MRLLTFPLALLATFLISACGGGGGSPGSTNGGTNPPTTPTTPQAVVRIVGAGNTPVTSISLGGTFTARATVTDATGAAVANRLVNFSITGAALATVNPTSALTNASGVAEVAITPASVSAVGATTLAASAVVGTATITGEVDFAVSAANVSLSSIALGSASLPSGGNTSLRVVAMRGGSPLTGVPVNVTFAASCGRINGTAGSFSVTTDGTGAAESVYSAVAADGSLCSGPVSVTASTAGASTVTSTVTVAAPTANAVSFVSATPAQIFIAGSGASEQSIVRFRVQSSAGTPLANVPVSISIPNNPGGVGLNATGATGSVTATTDAAGEVTVSVFSGTVPGPLRVRAELTASTPLVFAESQNLTVASGPPSQRFMSLSVSTFNIEGRDRDGTGTTLTARIADRQGNAVEDGTVINFTAEGGQVARSCATTRVNNISSCSVDFVSQNPRPVDGRASVLAFTNGTKDYVDLNGNNRFDGSDTLVQIGDAYRDDNENNLFDAGEFTLTRGGVATCTGSGGPFPGRANTCDGLLATTVRQQAVILFSSSTPRLQVTSQSLSSVQFRLGSSAPTPLLPMPAGTTITASALGGTCAVVSVQGSPVVNVNPTNNPLQDLSTGHSVNLMGCAAGNTAVITVTAPSGLATIFNVPL